MRNSEKYTPVVILGAGRSGTNILRDCLTQLPEFATWPCDEIQPIWRHGNLSHPTDEIPPELARPSVVKFIQNAFHKEWMALDKPRFLVEKTCANTLRVPFLEAVLDQPFYIHIVRHGGDVVPSAAKRWRGDLELPALSYFLLKARYIPLVDIPVYLWAFLAKRMGMIMGRKQRLSTWGPRFDGIDDWAEKPLEQLCSKQWVECAIQADNALAALPQERVVRVFYEDFITDPQSEIRRILSLVNSNATDEDIQDCVKAVRVKKTDKAARAIENKDVAEILAPALKQFGYGI